MALRAPDIKDEHGWRIHDEEGHLVGYSTSRDMARKAARGEIPMAVDLTPAEVEVNGDLPPVAVEGTVLPAKELAVVDPILKEPFVDPVLGRPKTPEELAAATAHEVNLRIKTLVELDKALWVQMSAELFIFREGKMWDQLGYNTFEAYLADPDVEINARWAYDLIAVYRQLVVERGVDPETLKELQVSKVRTVLPAIRREQITVKQAFADARSLARRDLETKYVGKTSTGGRPDTDSTIRTDNEPEWAVCPTCNSRYQVDPETGERVR